MKQNKNISGFSLLELIVVIAIMSVATLFGYPTLEKWNNQNTLGDAVEETYQQLSFARTQALARSTTVKVNISKSGETHTITTSYLTTARSSCDSGLTWVALDSKSVTLDDLYKSSGSGIGDICFYRDGTSSGGSLEFDPAGSSTTIGSADIDVIMATGFIDIIKDY